MCRKLYHIAINYFYKKIYMNKSAMMDEYTILDSKTNADEDYNILAFIASIHVEDSPIATSYGQEVLADDDDD